VFRDFLLIDAPTPLYLCRYLHDPTESVVRLFISTLSTAPGDILRVFDGATTSQGAQLAVINGSGVEVSSTSSSMTITFTTTHGSTPDFPGWSGRVELGCMLNGVRFVTGDPCPAGFEGSNIVCTSGGNIAGCLPCGLNSFKALVGPGSCTECAAGSTPNLGQTGCECMAGFSGTWTAANTGCAPCPANTFKAAVGTGNCTTCATASTTNGATAQSGCVCVAGSTGTWTITNGNCTVCPADTYSTVSIASVCANCPANTATVGSLVFDHDELADCTPGPGYFGAAGTVPTACPALFFKDVVGTQASSVIDAWPTTIDNSKVVHFMSVGDFLSVPPGASSAWTKSLFIQNSLTVSSDQITQVVSVAGRSAERAIAAHINIADPAFQAWANESTLDILVQAYLSPALANRSYHFHLGTLPNGYFNSTIPGGFVPSSASNGQWVWLLFRVANGFRPDGLRFLGSLASVSTGLNQYGGISNGTFRVQNCSGLIVRAVALGQRGAFGEPGSFGNFTVSAQASCTACPVNTYSNVSAASSGSVCIACPPNTVAPGRTASERDELVDCVAPPGFFGVSGQAATACPAGLFKDFLGQITGTVADCLPCTFAPNVYSDVGSSACLPCPPNTEALSLNSNDRNSVRDCKSRTGDYGPGLTCLRGSLPQTPTGADSATVVPRLDNVFCNAADSDADGWTGVLGSVRTAMDSCAVADGPVVLNRALGIPATEDRLVQLTWRAGLPFGGMLVTMGFGASASISAGCVNASATACELQILRNGQALGPATSVPINGSRAYVLAVLARPAVATLELQLHAVDATGSRLRIGSVGPQTLPPGLNWTSIQYGFVNLVRGFSCVQRYEIYSLCRSGEQAVNGECLGVSVCVGVIAVLTLMHVSFLSCRLHSKSQAVLW
jgi:hypothetical protein